MLYTTFHVPHWYFIDLQRRMFVKNLYQIIPCQLSCNKRMYLDILYFTDLPSPLEQEAKAIVREYKKKCDRPPDRRKAFNALWKQMSLFSEFSGVLELEGNIFWYYSFEYTVFLNLDHIGVEFKYSPENYWFRLHGCITSSFFQAPIPS